MDLFELYELVEEADFRGELPLYQVQDLMKFIFDGQYSEQECMDFEL